MVYSGAYSCEGRDRHLAHATSPLQRVKTGGGYLSRPPPPVRASVGSPANQVLVHVSARTVLGIVQKYLEHLLVGMAAGSQIHLNLVDIGTVV